MRLRGRTGQRDVGLEQPVKTGVSCNREKDAMETIHLTFMQKDEIGEAARVLSLAMLDNPLHVAVFRGTAEAQRLEIESMFIGLLHGLPEIVFVARESQRIVGVMRMKSCGGGKPADTPPPLGDENDLAWRKDFWHSEWARHEPPSPHWHLGPIGVLPSHQGKGIGSALMERFCAEVDGCKAEAYLETDLDENVRFYQKFGFKLIAESAIFGVANRYLLRPSRR
jgi:ribosomal protein S18 acetylase RimI-like enzyme